ncbi:MAG: YkgJ family cysteine cluster protein [Janthinobacterium lividum]
MRPPGDIQLVQIVDAALADAAIRSGDWLACRPGCNQCCTGVFRISQLDVERLQAGMHALDLSDPETVTNLRRRIHDAKARLSPAFPGDTATGLLFQDEVSQDAFEDFANDEVCPVLDPISGTCTLYDYRPMTCRTFGPPFRTEDGDFGVCELCFQGAPFEAIQQGELHLDVDDLLETLGCTTPPHQQTIVAFAFA